MDVIDQSGWLQQRLPGVIDGNVCTGYAVRAAGERVAAPEKRGGYMTSKQPTAGSFRKLIRNMRRMTEAGQLITCPICHYRVLIVNIKDGKCMHHSTEES